jgi:hypothetical protein
MCLSGKHNVWIVWLLGANKWGFCQSGFANTTRPEPHIPKPPILTQKIMNSEFHPKCRGYANEYTTKEQVNMTVRVGPLIPERILC